VELVFYRIDGELTPDRGRVLVMAFLIAGAAIPRLPRIRRHRAFFLPPPPTRLRISKLQ